MIDVMNGAIVSGVVSDGFVGAGRVAGRQAARGRYAGPGSGDWDRQDQDRPAVVYLCDERPLDRRERPKQRRLVHQSWARP